MRLSGQASCTFQVTNPATFGSRAVQHSCCAVQLSRCMQQKSRVAWHEMQRNFRIAHHAIPALHTMQHSHCTPRNSHISHHETFLLCGTQLLITRCATSSLTRDLISRSANEEKIGVSAYFYSQKWLFNHFSLIPLCCTHVGMLLENLYGLPKSIWS